MTRAQISAATISNVKVGPGFEVLVSEMLAGQGFHCCLYNYVGYQFVNMVTRIQPDRTCLNIAILSALEGGTCVAPRFALCGDS